MVRNGQAGAGRHQHLALELQSRPPHQMPGMRAPAPETVRFRWLENAIFL